MSRVIPISPTDTDQPDELAIVVVQQAGRDLGPEARAVLARLLDLQRAQRKGLATEAGALV